MSNAASVRTLQAVWQKDRAFVLWVILAFGVLVILALVSTGMSSLTQTQKQEFFRNPSVSNAQASGYKAWYLAMQELEKEPAANPLQHVSVKLWKKPFERLFDQNQRGLSQTMLMVSPQSLVHRQAAFDPASQAALLSWVAQGNTVIILDNFLTPTMARFLKRAHPRLVALPAFTALKAQGNSSGIPSEWLHIAPAIQLQGYHQEKVPYDNQNWITTETLSSHILSGQRIQSLGQTLEPDTATEAEEMVSDFQPLLLNVQERPVLVSETYGKGTLIIGTVSSLGANEYLQNTGLANFQFLSNLVSAFHQPLIINEYVHDATEQPDLMMFYIRQTPLGKIALQLVFLFLIVLWWSFTPFCPRREPARMALEDRVPMQSFVQSMAGIYARTQAATLVLSPYVHQITQLLRRRHRLSIDSTQPVTAEQSRQLSGIFKAAQNLGDGHLSDTLSPDAKSWQNAWQQALSMTGQPERKSVLPPVKLLHLTRQLAQLHRALGLRK